MIHSYTYFGRKFSFSRNSSGPLSKNFFTLIVGKNGTGKSTLLRSLVIDLLRYEFTPNALRIFNDISAEQREFSIGHISHKISPTKIICASTSPFDKFPILRKSQEASFYSYLGLRGLQSQNLGPAYMARVIYTLITAAKQSRAHAEGIATVLDYLEYEPELIAIFSTPTIKALDRIINENVNDFRESIYSYIQKGPIGSFESNLLTRQLLDADDKTLRQIHQAILRLTEYNRRGSLVYVLSSSGAESPTHPHLMPEDLSLLGRYGLVRLKEVELRKRGVIETLKISDMSSGEQSVVMSLLGIGSQLQDGALICIDEPEVCLHPEWQERYIQLISNIFSHYRGCHFIIATHSPQIVSQLPDERCYVMDMEDGIAHRSSEFSRKSVDYQLAALFKAPGFKNEYLSRVALNLFIKVAKEKKIDKESQLDYDLLNMSYDLLRNDDPLREVIESLREMHQKYG